MLRQHFLWFAVAVTVASPLQAALVHVFPRVSAVLNANFTPVAPASIVSSTNDRLILLPREEKYVVQVDILMTISDLQPPSQVGFHSASFDIDLDPGMTGNVDVPGWIRDSSEITIDGLPGTAPKWSDPCDCGGEPGDLLDLIIASAPRSFAGVDDPRLKLGIAPYLNGPSSPHTDGEFAGSIFVDIDGLVPQGLIEVLNVEGAAFNDQLEPSTANVTGMGGAFYIGVPEPSTLALLSVAAASALFMRRERRERP
jgi:hypothetical protein